MNINELKTLTNFLAMIRINENSNLGICQIVGKLENIGIYTVRYILGGFTYAYVFFTYSMIKKVEYVKNMPIIYITIPKKRKRNYKFEYIKNTYHQIVMEYPNTKFSWFLNISGKLFYNKKENFYYIFMDNNFLKFFPEAIIAVENGIISINL